MTNNISRRIARNILSIGILLLHLSVLAQSKSKKIAELHIGDTIPEITINKIFKKPAYIHLRDLKTNLLIINFWATWCAPCQRELPFLDSMKIKFGNKLNVLALSYEDSTKVGKYLNSKKSVHKENLLLGYGDTLLAKYFKHKYLPHNIWVDRRGIVRAITGSEDMTEADIKNFIEGKMPAMALKKDIISFDWEAPFHLRDSDFMYRSILTKYIDGISGGHVSWDVKQKGFNRFFGFNDSIVDLFWFIYTKNTPYPRIDYQLVRVKTKDSLRFFRPEYVTNPKLKERYKRLSEWEKDNLYCYDLSFPEMVPNETFYSYMLNDFERFFHVSYSTEQIPVLCNVVTFRKAPIFDLRNYKSTKDTIPVISFWKDKLTIRNATIGAAIHKILGTWVPFDDRWIDETGIDFPVDLVLTFDRSKPITLDVVKSKLMEFGLVFRQEVRPYNIMVLTDNREYPVSGSNL